MADRVALPPMRYRSVGDRLAHVVLELPYRRRWWIAFIASTLLVGLLAAELTHLFVAGVGTWGINIPVNWGMAISNVVWWIGIGHAGTFISAMLLLLGQDWRNSLNRFAEAMTLFAVLCAVIYPVIHLGRPYNFYWMLPYPTPFLVWPNFRSPLFWDVMAFTTYGTVSLIFWYVGAIPDFASIRDRARTTLGARVAGLAALGWRNSAAQWVRWRCAYVMLAAIAMPLVVSVHSGVSLLFAAGQIPGWHSTIYPPYFVLGALFSGFAVVGMIAVVLRWWFRLHDLITPRHFDMLARFFLATGLATAYGYIFEAFMAWYSGKGFETGTLLDRLVGPFWPFYWAAVVLNFVPIQLLWSKRLRTNPWVLFGVGLCVALGMWYERYMLVISGLFRDFLPSSWDVYDAPWTEWTIFIGLIGLFLFGMLLFVRFVPMISIAEEKEVLFDEHKKPPDLPEEAEGDSTVMIARPEAHAIDTAVGCYGTIARFDTAAQLTHAAEAAVEAGWRRVDAHMPFPLPEVFGVLGLKETRLPWIVAGVGLVALLFGVGVLWYVDVHLFPIPVRGMALASWPAYALPVFEFTVLCVSFATLLGMLVLNRLPRLNHPLFAAEGFERATRDGFFLVLLADDPRYGTEAASRFLREQGAATVEEVPT